MDLGVRIKQHKNRGLKCSQWTRKYPIKKVIWCKKTNNGDLELSKTLECINLYGIDNVRGSFYSRPRLSHNEICQIYDRLNIVCSYCNRFGHYDDECRCDICGRRGHLSNECYNCYNCGGKPDHFFDSCRNCYKCKSSYHDYRNCDSCYKCGRRGHFARSCRSM
jgi:hypothetical protein